MMELQEIEQCAMHNEPNREQQRLEAMRGQLEAVKASGGILTQIIQTADTADCAGLLLAAVKSLCLLRGEMVSYELIEQKIKERRQRDAQDQEKQTAGTGD